MANALSRISSATPTSPIPASMSINLLLRERHRRGAAFVGPAEREVIELRFGLVDGHPKTLDEVAQVYSITRERIRQIEARGLLKLRHASRSSRLEPFTEQQGR